MLEWLKRHAWKACKLQKGFGGSNPPLSARLLRTTESELAQVRLRVKGLHRMPSADYGYSRWASAARSVPSNPLKDGLRRNPPLNGCPWQTMGLRRNPSLPPRPSLLERLSFRKDLNKVPAAVCWGYEGLPLSKQKTNKIN